MYSGRIVMKDAPDIEFKHARVTVYENTVRVIFDKEKRILTVPFCNMLYMDVTKDEEK